MLHRPSTPTEGYMVSIWLWFQGILKSSCGVLDSRAISRVEVGSCLYCGPLMKSALRALSSGFTRPRRIDGRCILEQDDLVV